MSERRYSEAFVDFAFSSAYALGIWRLGAGPIEEAVIAFAFLLVFFWIARVARRSLDKSRSLAIQASPSKENA